MAVRCSIAALLLLAFAVYADGTMYPEWTRISPSYFSGKINGIEYWQATGQYVLVTEYSDGQRIFHKVFLTSDFQHFQPGAELYFDYYVESIRFNEQCGLMVYGRHSSSSFGFFACSKDGLNWTRIVDPVPDVNGTFPDYPFTAALGANSFIRLGGAAQITYDCGSTWEKTDALPKQDPHDYPAAFMVNEQFMYSGTPIGDTSVWFLDFPHWNTTALNWYGNGFREAVKVVSCGASCWLGLQRNNNTVYYATALDGRWIPIELPHKGFVTVTQACCDNVTSVCLLTVYASANNAILLYSVSLPSKTVQRLPDLSDTGAHPMYNYYACGPGPTVIYAGLHGQLSYYKGGVITTLDVGVPSGDISSVYMQNDSLFAFTSDNRIFTNATGQWTTMLGAHNATCNHLRQYPCTTVPEADRPLVGTSCYICSGGARVAITAQLLQLDIVTAPAISYQGAMWSVESILPLNSQTYTVLGYHGDTQQLFTLSQLRDATPTSYRACPAAVFTTTVDTASTTGMAVFRDHEDGGIKFTTDGCTLQQPSPPILGRVRRVTCGNGTCFVLARNFTLYSLNTSGIPEVVLGRMWSLDDLYYDEPTQMWVLIERATLYLSNDGRHWATYTTHGYDIMRYSSSILIALQPTANTQEVTAVTFSQWLTGNTEAESQAVLYTAQLSLKL